MNISELSKPFDPSRVSWRVGSTNKDKTKGMALAYVDARDVMDRLDEVCGVDGWQCRYSHATTKTVCDIGIKIGDGWIWKANGAGDSDVEAEKGAMSDAFKRAAVLWGIGRYLYDVKSPWVAIEAFGRSYKISDSEYPKLEALLGQKSPTAAPKPSPVEWLAATLMRAKSAVELGEWFALPKVAAAYANLGEADQATIEEAKYKKLAELERLAA